MERDPKNWKPIITQNTRSPTLTSNTRYRQKKKRASNMGRMCVCVCVCLSGFCGYFVYFLWKIITIITINFNLSAICLWKLSCDSGEIEGHSGRHWVMRCCVTMCVYVYVCASTRGTSLYDSEGATRSVSPLLNYELDKKPLGRINS